jgi:hypothetical protein
VDLKDCIKASEAEIKGLKRKVAKIKNVFLAKAWFA